MKSILRLVLVVAILGWVLLAVTTVQLSQNTVTPAQTEPIVISPLPPSSDQLFSMFTYPTPSSELDPQSATALLWNELTQSPYRIAYFATADAVTDEETQDSWLTPSRLLEGMTPPFVINNMDELRQLENEAPIEAIMLHQSAYDMIDREWLKPLLRRGVVLVTLNIPMVNVAELRNDSCTLARIDQINLDDETSGLDFFYIRDSHIFVENEADFQPLEAYIKQTCGEESPETTPPQLAARAYWGAGSAQGTLSSDFDLQQFQGLFTSHLLSLRSAQKHFAERDLPPTPIPLMCPCTG